MDEAERVARRRWRIGTLLTVVMMAAYFGFILLVALAPSLAGRLLPGDEVSVGIILGAQVIVLAPALTAVYVRWANRHYDPVIEKARRDVAR
jgi:uncharacterized membrane protein (DUF485 family)